MVHNGKGLAEVAEFKLQLLGCRFLVDYSFSIEFSTSAAILANLC